MWRWVVSITPWQLYLRGKNAWYPLDRRLCWSQSLFGHGDEEKNPLSWRESNPGSPGHSHYTDWPIHTQYPSLYCQHSDFGLSHQGGWGGSDIKYVWGKIQLGKPRCRQQDINKVYVMRIGYEYVNWFEFAWDRVQLCVFIWRGGSIAALFSRFLLG